MEKVSTDDGRYIPAKYSEFVEVSSKKKAETLAPHRPIDHAIDIEPGHQLPYGWIYNLSEFELTTLKAYIETKLANGFIQRSSSPAAAPILFAKKQDGGLRFCANYRALNMATVKNRYPNTLDLGDAGPTLRSPYLDKAGSSECLSPHPDQRR